MKRIVLAAAAALVLLLPGCNGKKNAVPEKHPHWTYNTVIYEVNTRQFSPEGTFAGVEAQLPRLKDLGVDILWFMPIYEIGTVERKGSLGSYYAISDYTKVNPEFGTMADFESLLGKAHELGFKVILDWVANQTAPDNVWMTTKPADFYERDAEGNAIYEYDWTDTRSLNYENEQVWWAQDECMRFWLEKGVDGFRCDAAAEVPSKFWKAILPKMKADYPEMYLLAEAESKELIDPKETFDASYAWNLHHLMNDIAQGKKNASDLKDYIAKDDVEFGKENFRMMFTSNHDENSWSGSEFERMGEAANAMAVLCFTLPKGQPLVYTGQEVGITRRIEFFEKDPVADWSANQYTAFFKDLIKFRHANSKVLAPGEQGAPIQYLENDNPNVFAFSRGEGKDKVVVVVNLSSEPASAKIKLDGKYYSAFGGQEYSPKAESFELGAWQYCLMSKKK